MAILRHSTSHLCSLFIPANRKKTSLLLFSYSKYVFLYTRPFVYTSLLRYSNDSLAYNSLCVLKNRQCFTNLIIKFLSIISLILCYNLTCHEHIFYSFTMNPTICYGTMFFINIFTLV